MIRPVMLLSMLLSFVLVSAAFAQDEASEPMTNIADLSIATGTIADHLTEINSAEANCDAKYETFTDDEGETSSTFTCLLEAVQIAGLAETLMGEGPFTVFAPTDRAFFDFTENQGLNTPSDIFADTEALSAILLHHVGTEGKNLQDLFVSAESEVTDTRSLPTADGQELNVTFNAPDEESDETVVTVGEIGDNGPTYVVGTAISVDNGFIIPISQVLMPAMEMMEDTEGDDMEGESEEMEGEETDEGDE